eukprot:TRINITY_DN18396_c0_g1_i2.p1 TRINITY_DN18396_c0_g1~~TRINITY_DN18396_c0_g1_i2.p1  ORF type:complete len:184 (+),score=37.79 TRINITY_DN18396_c0_g1_i2:27-554(+)
MQRVVLVGDHGSGKTSLIHRCVGYPFPPATSPTVFPDFTTLRLLDSCLCQMWELPSNPSPHMKEAELLRRADAVVVVFDLASALPLQGDRVEQWLDKAHVQKPEAEARAEQQQSQGGGSGKGKGKGRQPLAAAAVVVLLGTKADLLPVDLLTVQEREQLCHWLDVNPALQYLGEP